jgi:site-specific DNA-methyltransferase (adenine-specific)
VNKILQGDCLDIMKDIDNDTFDIIVSSPPYNIGINYNTYEDKKVDYIDWQVKVWEEAFRVLKPTGHLFLNIQPSRKNPLWCYELVSKLSWKLQNTIIWNKQLEIDNHIRGQGTSFQSEKYLPNGWEFIFHLTRKGNTKISQEKSGVAYQPKYAKENRERYNIGGVRPTVNTWYIPYETIGNGKISNDKLKGGHPAVFPRELVRKCIKLSGLENGTLFDCFAGSGTSLIAAKEMGLDYFGCDLDKDYVEFMKARLDKVEQPLKMWEKFGG